MDLRSAGRAGKRRPLVQSPTGSGKGVLIAHLVRGALDKDRRVAVLAPATALIDQTVGVLEHEGVYDVGVMQADHERTNRLQPVQVCCIQTLARRTKPDVDLVIVDEAHVLYSSLLKWMGSPSLEHVPVIGLSATPWTKGLGQHYDHLIVAATTRELINDGYLSDFVVFAPSDPDLSNVSSLGGEFKQDDLGDVMDVPSITGDIVSTWLQRGENRPTLCYCVNRKHAQHVCERFLEAGVAAEYMDGKTPPEDRSAALDRFRAGETRVICNVGVLTTGVDLGVRCIIDAKPTKSKILFVQTIGRGLRTAPGKDRLIILDHAGNHLRLGMVTDIGQDRLDGGSERTNGAKMQEKTAPLPCLCQNCKAVIPREAKACSVCGEKVTAISQVLEVAGELVELCARRSGRCDPTMAEKEAFLGELKFVALERGYDTGWAAHKYREKFGVWPNDPRVSCAKPALPSLETKNWLKSRQIAYVKRRAG